MSVKQALNKVDRNYLILAFITIFFLASNIIWIKENQAPPMWDQSHYLLHSDILYHTLTKEGVIPFAKAFTNAIKTKAPLITILPIPFYLLFGDNETSALFVNLAFIILGSCFMYKLAVLISGPRAGLLSVFILNTFPLIFAMSREFFVEYGLMVIVIIWMYYLLKSDCFDNRIYAYVLGIILGLGMLMKITFVLYIIFPTLFIFIERVIKSKKISSLPFKNIFIVVLTGVLVSGTWYFKNLSHILGFVWTSGYGSIAKNYGWGTVFSIKTILIYWGYAVIYGISIYYFLLMIFLIFGRLISFFNNEYPADIKRKYVLFLSIWFVVPFLVFTFGENKDYRYAAPLYPALALLMSIYLARISSRFYGAILLFVLLLFPAVNYLFISFSSTPFSFNIRQVTVFSHYLAFAHPPVKERWPYETLIQAIHEEASRTNNTDALTTLLFDHEYMNRIASNYYAENNHMKIRFETCDYSSKEDVKETADRIERNSDYLVTKSDKLGPDFSNAKNVAVLFLMNEGKLNFKKILTIPLPDQTFLTVYKKNLDKGLRHPGR